jgi:hypothetical protein
VIVTTPDTASGSPAMPSPPTMVTLRVVRPATDRMQANGIRTAGTWVSAMPARQSSISGAAL